MKQHIFKQNLLAKLTAITLVVVMVIVASCNKESFNTQAIGNNAVNEVSKSDAQQWFEAQQSSTTSKYLKTMKPNWNSANSEGGFTYAPIQFDSGEHFIPSLFKGTAYLGREKLAITDKGGKFTGYICDFLPSKEFKGNVDLINFFNFKDQNFDGKILLKNLSGENLHGIEVKNGVIKKRFYNPALIKYENMPEELICFEYIYFKCHQTPGCCCIECEAFSQTICFQINNSSSNGSTNDPIDPFDPTGYGGYGSASPRDLKIMWIRTNLLGAVENILLGNNSLYEAVHRFIVNSGDATLFAPVVTDAFMNQSNNRILFAYFKYLADNEAYLSALQLAGFPTIGSQEWAEITENNVTAPASVKFQGFSSKELERFLVIPEDVTSTALYMPSNATEGNVDGFFNSGWTNDHYWFKISKNGRATVRRTNTGFDITEIYEDPFWKWIAELGGRFYCTCWQDINRPRPIDNPLPH
jgi:hypothetical protein